MSALDDGSLVKSKEYSFRGQAQFPAPTGLIITIYDSCRRGSAAPSWPSQAPGTQVVHRLGCEKNPRKTHILTNCKFKFSLKEKEMPFVTGLLNTKADY